MGVGHAAGKGKAEDAARAAVASPLMETSIDGARGVLINITGSMDMGLEDVEAAANLVQAAAHPEANIIFGATFDDTMDDEIRVTVIATGFDDGPVKKPGDSRKEREPSTPQGLFSAASEMAGANTNRTPSQSDSPKKEEDPFDSIFKIFNSK